MNKREKIYILVSLIAFVIFALLFSVPFRTEKKKKDIRISAVMPEKTDSFWNGVWKGIEQQTEEMNISLSKYRYSTGNNIEGIIQKLETAILSETQGIVLCANQYQSAQIRQLLKEAKKSGIKMVLCDTDADTELRDAFVGVDNEKAGKDCAEYLKQQKEIQKVIVIKNREEQISGATGQRASSFERNFESRMPEQLLSLPEDDNEKYRILTDTLETVQKGTAVICFNSSTTTLVAQTIKRTAKESEVLFIGFSESEEAQAYTQEGIIDRLYMQDNEELGRKSAQVLEELIEGRDVAESLYIDMIYVEGGDAE